MHLFTDRSGNLKKSNPGATSLSAVSVPASVGIRSNRPDGAHVRRSNGSFGTVIVARYDPGLVWVESASAVYELGIATPAAGFSVAAFGGGLTGTATCYINARHKIGSVVVAQSNLLLAPADVALNNQGLRWSGLPVTHANSRVTHIGLWRAIDGDVPHLVADVTLGTATYDEAITDAARRASEAAPTYLDSEGVTTVDMNARGVPPYCLYVASYHYRAYYAGVPAFPSRLYRSRIGEPESVNLSTGYDDTPGGESITGLGVGVNNELIVFHARGAYAVQGYSDTDISWRPLVGSEGYGCINGHGIRNMGGWLLYPSHAGICVYDGMFRNVMARSMRTYWISDYATNTTAYESGWAMANPTAGKYQFSVTKSAPTKTFAWVGFTRPMVEDGEPEPYWGLRVLGREESYGEVMYDSSGMHGSVYYGGDDGYIRKDDGTNADDDGDTYQKKWLIRGPHLLPGTPAGDDSHARDFTALDVGLKHENQDATASLYCGDDEAWTAARPSWTDTLKRALRTIAGKTKVPKKTEHVEPIMGASGKGAMLEIEITAPVGIEYAGMELTHKEGEQDRPLTT